MIRENSEAIWYGVFIAIIFFSFRFLFEAWRYPVGDEMMRNGYAGGIALVAGIGIGYLLRNQLELTRFFIAGGMLAAGILANVFLS